MFARHGEIMDLKEIMQEQKFAVVGDTLKSEKYAYKIKAGLLAKGYTVYGVGKELASLNDIAEDIDIVDLCINPKRGLEFMKESKKPCKCVVLQPGAGDDALKNYLREKGIPFIDGCLLVGMKLYPRKESAK